ncbi:MAG TPA: AAA family ATPase, partial [Candidatus Babeliales bacterium]|nr:AAA family ATPase [Candidatus Babeliales bacterium]
LLPVVGRRRVYLIDEAHMLSKAAFNAFLKVLEEPPHGVLFILATTDPQKIIETVRSRCFQLFFGAIEATTLLTHLQQICTAEQIAAEPAALELIVQETDGCARDAINLLERVRFSDKCVTLTAVTSALGYPEQQQLERLVACLLLEADPAQMLPLLTEINLLRYAPDAIWKRLLNLMRQAWRLKFNLTVTGVTAEFSTAVQSCSVERLVIVLEAFCMQEQLFMRSAYPQLFLELFLLATLKKKV